MTNIEQQKQSAIKLFKAKQQVVLKNVKTHKYSLKWSNEDYVLAIFKMHCERLRAYGVPIKRNILALKIDHFVDAAYCFVYLEQLIARLNAGEDPSLVLLEVMSIK